jgi:CheY-like chemotaxis protein
LHFFVVLVSQLGKKPGKIKFHTDCAISYCVGVQEIEDQTMSIFDRLRTIFNKDSGSRDVGASSSTQSEQERAERRRSQRQNAREGTKILIIDDSPTVIFAFKKILQHSGLSLLDALDAEKGIALVREHKPDLIFLDIVLPGMNGFAALRALRRDPTTQAIPIIMISSNEQATEQFFGSKIGADDFLKKPFNRTEVFSRISRLLDHEGVPRRVSDSTEGSGKP